jgi:diguanylate cyclase (GGDEF)-like protein
MAGSAPTAGALLQATAPRVLAHRFPVFAAATIAAAVVAVAALVPSASAARLDEGTFWLLAGAIIASELLPIRLPRRDVLEEVVLSTTFAFTLMLWAGPLPAIGIYAAGVLLRDALDRTEPLKAVFNAAQESLSILAGAAVLALAAVPAPSPGYLDGALPFVLLAAVATFAVNQLLAGTATALLTDGRVRDLVLGDLPYQVWTGGFLLTLAPLALDAVEDHPLLLPLLFLPLIAIRIGGGQAVLNAHRAWHDDLTDLPNRLLLHQRAADALEQASRHGDGLVVAILDLNAFKAVNDTLGHARGDELLRDVGARLRAAAPPEATLARLGGDEFGFLLPTTTLADGRFAVGRIISALDEPFDVDGLAVQVDASAGLAAFPQHGRTAQDLLRHADVALYAAKSNQMPVEAYSPDDDEHSIDRLALAAQLRRGLQRGELIVHFQAKLALGGGRRHGVEALARWNHPQLGLIGPEGFIPLAEQSSLLKPLTLRVLDEALRQTRLWRDEGLDLRVSVNLSARSLLDHDLPGDVGRLLAKWGLPSSALQLEITESRLVSDFGRAERVLTGLRDLGVGLAIDDFGTGFSSLAQLQRLPVQEIKIDKSFVLNMATSADDAAIVRSTIELGRTLALDVTAEGVETPEAFAQLTALGCHFAQGYHVGRPAPGDACARDLRRFIRDGAAAAEQEALLDA